MEIFTNFVKFIMSFVQLIQDLVKYIRAKNDGAENAAPPALHVDFD